MPKPRYETWFMEGTLIPDYHFIQIKDDYSDLQEKLVYYNSHLDEALQIIENAHQYIYQFKNKKQEDLISLLVIKRYFERTGQIVNSGVTRSTKFINAIYILCCGIYFNWDYLDGFTNIIGL